MKKGLSLLLVLVMIFSLLSAGALAAEEEPTEEIAEETIAELTEESTEAATEEATAETVEAKETTEEATEESTEDFPISLDGNGDLLDSGTCGENVTWTLTSDGVLTISGEGAMADYYSSGAPWYSYQTYITNAVIKYSVTSIGSYAFYNCTSLESITIPDRVTSIGMGAFFGCISLENITLPDSTTSIDSDAFLGCISLESITIPSEVTLIGVDAFCGCEVLTEIHVDESNTTYCSEQGVLFNKERTRLVCYPAGKTEDSYTIPTGVTSIGPSAFSWCNSLTSITIQAGVTSIGSRAFFGCRSLTNITIPRNVTSIGDYAFNDCTALTDVYYGGTEAERNAISINSGNTPLTGATWHYSETGTSITSDEVEVLIGKAVSGDIVVTVTANGVTLVENEDYTLTSTEVDGMISVTLKGCGDYIGNATKTLDHTPGDMDGKDGVTILDVLALLKAVAGITDEPAHADVNGDDDVTILDVLALLKYVAGISGSVVY